jgi:hypothetical protein
LMNNVELLKKNKWKRFDLRIGNRLTHFCILCLTWTCSSQCLPETPISSPCQTNSKLFHITLG